MNIGLLRTHMKSDFLVIGGGVIGLATALELKKRHREAQITVLEKETSCGAHASGRNSGVLHAGFYYTADSLKARFTLEGNKHLTRYCEDRNLAIKKCGKLVVAQKESDLPWLDELLKRAAKNGVPLQNVSAQEAREIEPRAKTYERALWSPATSSVNPGEVMKALALDAAVQGITIKTGTRYVRTKNSMIETNNGVVKTDYLINAAGLYADTIAQHYGFGQNYRILPFKGLYLYSSEPAGSLCTNIYPVPNLANPFLGVHFTVTAEGRTKIGPTAIPAFWREQYGSFADFNPQEAAEIILRQAGLLLKSDFDFKRLAWEEMRKYSRAHLLSLAAPLLQDLDPAHYTQWGKPGIRAQLLDIKNRKLEMDFVLEGDKTSMHVLNAVSPAFTCAFPFAKYVCDKIEELR
jgi:(S)-2-hydroxyglutarate dehydrogenase